MCSLRQENVQEQTRHGSTPFDMDRVEKKKREREREEEKVKRENFFGRKVEAFNICYLREAKQDEEKGREGGRERGGGGKKTARLEACGRTLAR